MQTALPLGCTPCGNAAPAICRISVFSGLKGCAKCLGGASRVLRAYRDLRCRAIGFAIVIVAVLNVAFDASDVLAIAIAHLCSLFFHDSNSFPNGILHKIRACARIDNTGRISPSRQIVFPSLFHLFQTRSLLNVTLCNCRFASFLGRK